MIKFIEKASKKHNNKYDYSLVDYKGSRIKVKIICPIHGVFEQEPANHNRGQGCPSCKGVKKSTKENFITKANEVHDNIYDYSLVEYKNNKTKVKIICSEHGEFEQRPDNHLNKKTGCPKCANNMLYTNEDFILKANKVHNNNYNYDKVEYISAHNKVMITCPIHGDFSQEPYSHLQGYGCSKCSMNYNYSSDEYIEKAKEIHGNKYDYSLVEYINNHSNIKIICPIHGEYESSPKSHISGNGCQKCYLDSIKMSKEEFIKRAKETQGNFYDYSLVEYENSYTKIKIICPKHGIFEQIPSNHLRGYGCQSCNASRGEKEVQLYLENNNIYYKQQFKFEDCKNINCLPFDFFLPDYNICIEYDGLQHFKPIEYFGGNKTFERTQKNDNIKTEFCKNNEIKLIRIKYNENVTKKLKNL